MTAGSIFASFRDSVSNWPGFIANLLIWYLQEFVYYSVLFYWTTLDYSFVMIGCHATMIVDLLNPNQAWNVKDADS